MLKRVTKEGHGQEGAVPVHRALYLLRDDHHPFSSRLQLRDGAGDRAYTFWLDGSPVQFCGRLSLAPPPLLAPRAELFP